MKLFKGNGIISLLGEQNLSFAKAVVEKTPLKDGYWNQVTFNSKVEISSVALRALGITNESGEKKWYKQLPQDNKIFSLLNKFKTEELSNFSDKEMKELIDVFEKVLFKGSGNEIEQAIIGLSKIKKHLSKQEQTSAVKLMSSSLKGLCGDGFVVLLTNARMKSSFFPNWTLKSALKKVNQGLTKGKTDLTKMNLNPKEAVRLTRQMEKKTS